MTEYTTSSSFKFELLTSLTEYGFIQDRLPGDDLQLPHDYDDLKIKPNDHVTAQTINFSLEKIHTNWLYLISSSVIPSNSIPNTDYANRMVVDDSTDLMVVRGIEQPGEYAPRPKWLSTFNDVEQFKSTAAQGDQWRNRLWEDVKDITKIQNVANTDHYNFVANTTTNLILLSGTDVATPDNPLGQLNVIGNFNDENNPIYSNSNVTHPSNEVLFRDIKNHVVTDDKDLYVLDGFHRTIFKFDINGMLSLDTAILLNDTPGRLMTGMIGGPGTITDKTRFAQPIVMETVNNLLYVVDYSSTGSSIKTFDSDLNWKGTFDLGNTLADGPIDLKYNDETRRFYVMCHKRTFFGTGDDSPLTTAEQIEPAELVVFDSSFNYIETRDLNDTTYSANINVEVYKRIYFSIENKNIMYVLTNKGVYKKYVNRPERFIGEFLLSDKNVGGGDRSQNFQDMTFFEAAITEGTDVLQKDEILLLDGFYQVLFEFYEDSNYERSIQTEFDDKVLYFDDLKVYEREYVSTLTYNKVFTKHVYNNALLIENTYRKFTTKFNPSGIPQYIGFRYLNETQLDQTNYDVSLDHYIGTNEIVTTNTFNRCMEQILEIQNNVKDKMQEKSINVFPLITSPVLLVSPFADAAIAVGVDTDFDGIPDSADYDDDDDGLLDTTEIAIGTDPLLIDSDDDGLTDYEEHVVIGTDPKKQDTDGDGAADGFDTFPLNPAASVDTDGDGLPDSLDPNVDNINPVLEEDRDDDNDGFLDTEDQFSTDPNRVDGVDLDGDGVDDGIETDADQDGVIDLRDADSDGASDTGDTLRALDDDIDGDGFKNDTETSTVPEGEIKDDFPFDPDRVDGVDLDGDGVDDVVDDDRDGDNLTNTEELNGTEITDTNGDKHIYTSDPNVVDSDGDGLSDFKEVGPGGTGTDPENIDTDGDGVRDDIDAFPQDAIASVDTDGDGKPDEFVDTNDDGQINELDNRTPISDGGNSPPLELDADDDNDGLTDTEEAEYGSDPLNPDTDGDGLLDGAEVNTHETDPTNIDSDGDGITDSQELTGFIRPDWITDPNDTDTDNDGISDFEEQTGTYIPEGDSEVSDYVTNPTTTDTDGDSMSDKAEQDGVTSDMSGETHETDPTTVDSDGDGLSDDKELGFDTEFFNNLEPAVATISDRVPGGFGSSRVNDIIIQINDVYFRASTTQSQTGAGTQSSPHPIYTGSGDGWQQWANTLRAKLSEQAIKDATLVEPSELGDPFAGYTLSLSAIQPGSIGNNYTINITGNNSNKVTSTVFAGGVDDTSDPNASDTDSDGLSDLDEIVTHETVLRDPDTDDDNVLDGTEVDLGIEPLDSDTDDDGLTDGQEVNGVTASDGETYTTNAKEVDSDGDTISDADELNLGGELRSDPNDTDTDDDGLRDDIDQTPLVASLQFKPVDQWPSNFAVAGASDNWDVTYTHPDVVSENDSSSYALGGVVDGTFLADSIGALFVNPDYIESTTSSDTTHFTHNTTTRAISIDANQDFEEDGFLDNPYRETIVTVTDKSSNQYMIKYVVLITDVLLALKNTVTPINPVTTVTISTELSSVEIVTKTFNETAHNDTAATDTFLIDLDTLFDNPIEISPNGYQLTNHTSSIITHNSTTAVDSFRLDGSELYLRPQDFESSDLIVETNGTKHAACTIGVINHGQQQSTFTITVSAQITNIDSEDSDQDLILDSADDTKFEPQLQFVSSWDTTDGYIASSLAGAGADQKTVTTTNVVENNDELEITVIDELFVNPDYFDTTSGVETFYKVGQPTFAAGDENFEIKLDPTNNKWTLYLKADRDFENLVNLQSGTTATVEMSFMARGQQSDRSHDKQITVRATITEQLLVFKTGSTGLVIDSQNNTKATYTHPTSIDENSATTQIIDIRTLLDNLEELSGSSITSNSTGNKYTLTNHVLSLRAVDHETHVDQQTDFISCEITITDHSTPGGNLRTLTLNINTTINDLYDEDADGLTEADDPDRGAQPSDATELAAGLQFTNGDTTKSLAFTIAEGGGVGTVLVSKTDLQALFDNPDYLRDTNPFTLSDIANFEIDDDGNVALKVAQDYETAPSRSLTITAHAENSTTKHISFTLTVTDVELGFANLTTVTGNGNNRTYTLPTNWIGFDAKKLSSSSVDDAVLENNPADVVVVSDLDTLFTPVEELRNNPYSLSSTTDFKIVGKQLLLKANRPVTTTAGNATFNKTVKLTIKSSNTQQTDLTLDFSVPITGLAYATGGNGTMTAATLDENTTGVTAIFTQLQALLLNDTLLPTTAAWSVNDTTNFKVGATGVELQQAQDHETKASLPVTITVRDRNNNTIDLSQTVNITDVYDEDQDSLFETDKPGQDADTADLKPDTYRLQLKNDRADMSLPSGGILPEEGITITNRANGTITFDTNNVQENNTAKDIIVLNEIFDNADQLHADTPFYTDPSNKNAGVVDDNYEVVTSGGQYTLRLKSGRDHETDSAPSLTIYARDKNTSSFIPAITVSTTLIDLPDVDLTWVTTGGNINTTKDVDENTTTVGTVQATGDLGFAIEYSIVSDSNTNGNLFNINSTTGVITFISAPVFNQGTEEGSGNNNSYTLKVLAKYTANYPAGHTPDTSTQATKTITVTVKDVQDIPITFKIDGNTPTSGSGTSSNPYVYSKSVDENTNSFATINVEGDTEGDINMELSGLSLVTGHGSNQRASHTLTQATGAYQATIAKTEDNYDAENGTFAKFYLAVKASYSNVSPTHDVYLAIKMTVNDLPDTILQWNNTNNITASVNENAALSVNLSNYGPTGAADDAATVQYVITQDTGNDFTINGNTLSWNNGSTGKDYEAGATRTCKIRMRYATGDTSNTYQSSEKTVNITLNDLADTNITWTSNTATTSVDENAALNYNLSSLINSFDDAAGTKQDLVYQITGGNQSSDFAISGHTLNWDNGSNGKNYETRTSYQVKLRARYAAGQTTNQSPELTITVNLNDVADVAPTITGGAGSYTIESETANSSLFTLTGTSDTGNNVTWASSNSKFTITSNVNSGAAATVGYNGVAISTSSVTVTFTCKDSGNTSLQSTKSVTIAVNQPSGE